MSLNVFNLGVNNSNSKRLNRHISVSNFVSVLLGILSIPFIIFTYYFFYDLLIFPILFLIACLLSLLLNYLQLYQTSRITVALGLGLIYSIYHSYLLPNDSNLITSLFACQLIFTLIPFLVFGIDERKYLFSTAGIVMMTAFFIPELNSLFTYTSPNIHLFTDGWLSKLLIGTSVISCSGAVFFLMFMNHEFENKMEEFVSDMERTNTLLKEKESELNKQLVKINEKIEEDKKREWVVHGVAELSKLLSANPHPDRIISYFVKYLNVNQGALFIKHDEESNEFLEMEACYAYSRKKFINKRIELGNGLVGQVFLEKEKMVFKKVPDNYISITSGLGEATPSSLLIAPLIYQQTAIGVIELASFSTFEEHQIEFVEKASEILAGEILRNKINEETKILLEKSRLAEEELRAQEEELKQNMEEMTAAQEEMQRKEKEYLRQIHELQSV